MVGTGLKIGMEMEGTVNILRCLASSERTYRGCLDYGRDSGLKIGMEMEGMRIGINGNENGMEVNGNEDGMEIQVVRRV